MPELEPARGSPGVETEARITCVATDMDGTLVAPDHTLPPSVEETYAKLVAAGLRVIVCTGRVMRAARTTLADLGSRINVFPGIYSHGACAYDHDGHLIYCHTMERNTLVQLINKLYEWRADALAQPADPGFAAVMASSYIKDFRTFVVCVYTADRFIIDHETPEFAAFAKAYNEQHDTTLGRDFTADDLEGVTHFSLTANPQVLAYIRRHMEDYWRTAPEEAHLKLIVPVIEGLHFLNKRVDKARALQSLAAKYDFNRENILALGDSDNDVEMLRWAGVSVAMGNGSDSAKQAAQYLTDDARADGWANAVRRFALPPPIPTESHVATF